MKSSTKTIKKDSKNSMFWFNNNISLDNLNHSIYNSVLFDMKPRYFDFSYLMQEIEKYKNELEKAKKENEQEKSNYEKYFSNNSLRENELRYHINSLSNKVHIRDVKTVKNSMNNLHEQILSSINLIEGKVKSELSIKKKDIENRIHIRLMDSEFRHKEILENKVKEQNNFLTNLLSVTQEMTKIKENYLKILERISEYSKSIDMFKSKLKTERQNSNKLKYLLKYYKIQLKKTNERISENLNHDNSKIKTTKAYNNESKESYNNQLEEDNTFLENDSIISKMSFERQSKLDDHLNSIKKKFLKNNKAITEVNSPNKIKNKKDNQNLNNTNNKSLRSSNQEPLIILDESIISTRLDTEIKSIEYKGSERVLELINNPDKIVDVYKNHPNSKRTISLSLNTYTTEKAKLERLKHKMNEMNKKSSFITDKVAEVIKNIKLQNYDEDQIQNIDIYNSMEDRQKFIDKLYKNKDLLSTYNDDTFPTVNVAFREIFN